MIACQWPGAAIGAAAVGWYPSITAAGEAMVGETHRIAPDPQVAERYGRFMKVSIDPSMAG